MNRMLMSYAYDFCSFLMQNMDENEISDMLSIILFGSVSRRTATPKSDVDIFVDMIGKNRLKQKIMDTPKKFYDSDIYKRYWKLLGVRNNINVIAGSIDEWKDLKNSIVQDGIYMYKKYDGSADGKNFVIISWDKIESQSKRTHLSKKLYGWKYDGKAYAGILEKTGGTRLGANVIMIPIENFMPVTAIFKSMKIKAKIRHVNVIE